jgi:hypothetical protein
MGWWTSVTDRARNTGSTVLDGAKWVWDNASLHQVGSTLFTFTVNTTFHVLEEALALRKAIPSILYNKKAENVVKGMSYLLINDVAPLVGLNYINNSVQHYFRDGYNESNTPAMYSIFLSALSLGQYAVTAYTWKHGAQTLVRVAVLDAYTPLAANSNPHRKALTGCDAKIKPAIISDALIKSEAADYDDEFEGYDCNSLRFSKGLGRELAILWANDALIWSIGRFVPYIGPPLAQVLAVMNNGRYIVRAVTPERCERHKNMEQEFVMALGLTHAFSCWLLDQGLSSTTGPLPFIYLRALRHILLAFHINLAAHMDVPLVGPNDATLPIDVFNYYERAWRFILDVFWAGLLKRIPIDFKPERGALPFIPLSSALQFTTRLLNSDVRKEKDIVLPNQWVVMAKNLLLPPIFRSSYDFPNDPVLAPFWPEIRSGAISIISEIENYRNPETLRATLAALTKNPRGVAVAVLAKAPTAVAVFLNVKFGIPGKVTRVVLMLSAERDFWDLARALRSWFERHQIKVENVQLISIKGSAPALRDEGRLLPPPPAQVPQLVPPPPSEKLLIPEKKPEISTSSISADQLMSTVKKRVFSGSADMFFSTKPPKPAKGVAVLVLDEPARQVSLHQ